MSKRQHCKRGSGLLDESMERHTVQEEIDDVSVSDSHDHRIPPFAISVIGAVFFRCNNQIMGTVNRTPAIWWLPAGVHVPLKALFLVNNSGTSDFVVYALFFREFSSIPYVFH